MITTEYSEVLRGLFSQMFVDGKRCENWDLIMLCHDQEDIDYFEMLAKRLEKKTGGN